MSIVAPSADPIDPAIAIIAECERKKSKWTDPAFPPNDRSLGDALVKKLLKLTKGKPIVWKRASEIVPNPDVLLPPVDAHDIRQGSLGDCWLLSGIAALACDDEKIGRVMVTKKCCEWGVRERFPS